MAKKIRHIAKKDIIRSELVKLARAKPLLTECYSHFGNRTNTKPRGPSKAVLDLIAEEEKAAGRPDITVLLVRKVRSGIGYQAKSTACSFGIRRSARRTGQLRSFKT
jgi:hypothetical protein